MSKQVFTPRSRNLRFPFLTLLLFLPTIAFPIYLIIQREPAEHFYNVAISALAAFLSVISGIASLASWGNGMAVRIEELEEKIKKLRRPEE